MSTQKNEHNPDWTPNQYGAPDWRLLSRDEDTQQDGDEWWDWEDGRWMLVEPHMFGKRPLVGLTYRRRITPPTDTTRSGREGETVETDRECFPVEVTGPGGAGTDTEYRVDADFARQLERQRDAARKALQSIAMLPLNSEPRAMFDRAQEIATKALLAAIDSAQRQEGR